MTVAVLLGATGLDETAGAQVRADLRAALRDAGVPDVREPAAGAEFALIAELARTSAEPVLLCSADLVGHRSLLWMLTTEPGGRTAALVDPAADRADVREERGRLVPGEPTARFLGAICVAVADLPRLAAAADHLSGGGVRVCAADALLPGLLAEGLTPAALRLRLLRAERVTDGASLGHARAAVDAVDEDSARLRLAVKERDDFFTTYAVSSWSPWVTGLAARLGLTPTIVTGISVLFAVAAALCFWQASRPAMIAGGVLLYLGFVLDCVDGQLARYTRRFDAFGGWLDTMADRAKEYAAYAGLAAGAERMGLHGAWSFAIAAMVLQTVRHMTDAWYGALHDEAARRPAPVAAGGLGGRLSKASERVQADTGSAAYWLKRIVVFPIGERWALIAVAAAFTNGRVTLLAVLGWAVLAFVYTLGLRSLRSRSMRVAVLNTVDTARHRDDGVWAERLGRRVRAGAPLLFALFAALASAALGAATLFGPVSPWWIAVAGFVVVAAGGVSSTAPHTGPLDWLVPAALRAAEYLFWVAAGLVGPMPAPLIFLCLFLVAMHHYDVTSRMEKAAPEPDGRSPGSRSLHGWDGRIWSLSFSVTAVSLLALTGWWEGDAVFFAMLVTTFGLVWESWRGARPIRRGHHTQEAVA